MSSWYAYRLIQQDSSDGVTRVSIHRSMKLFEKKYKPSVEFIDHPELLVWDVVLEEKLKRPETRSKSSSNAKKDAPPTIKKFIFAFYAEDGILFANKRVSKEIQNIMSKVLHCEGFKLQLEGQSTPSQLLMLFKQSDKQNPGCLELDFQAKELQSIDRLRNGIPICEDVEKPPVICDWLYRALGSDPERIPKISRVSLTVENMPIHSTNPNLEGFRLSQIDLELKCPSVFHLYKSLAEQGIVTSLPSWLQTLRSRGTTSCTASYT